MRAQMSRIQHSSRVQSSPGAVPCRQGRWRSSQPQRGWHHTIPPQTAKAAALPQQAVAELAAGPLSDIAGVTIAGGIIAGLGWSLLPLLSGRAQVPHSYRPAYPVGQMFLGLLLNGLASSLISHMYIKVIVQSIIFLHNICCMVV